MFDAATARLIRAAPEIGDIDPRLLPQELTSVYAELAGLRLRGSDLAADQDYAMRLERLRKIAVVYEALVDTGSQGEERRAAAFVAATAYQILGRVLEGEIEPGSLLTAGAVSPLIAAPLLFLIAEQNPDAREAARPLAGVRTDDLLRSALIETVFDLADERFQDILDRAERLARLRSSAEQPLDDRAVQALYGLCWSAVAQMVSRLLDRPMVPMAFQGFESPQLAFDRVDALAAREIEMPGLGGKMWSAYSGPRHLARLLRHVADAMEGAGITNVPAPTGAEPGFWTRWLRHRAESKPVLWRNHRAAIATSFLDQGRSAVLVLPTGAGKTTLSELKIAATLAAGRKVIFLVPTLALVDQLRDDLAESFPVSLAQIEVSSDGDLTALIAGPELKNIEVMTPERCLAVLSFADADVADIGLIVFDECHLLSPQGGGSRSTDAMLCLLHALKRAPEADFLLLSAMLQNAQEVADWLRSVTARECVSFLDSWKPSRQARGVVIYPRSQIARIEQVKRQQRLAERAGQRFVKPPLPADPYALFGLHNTWVQNAPADTRIVRLAEEAVELTLGKTGAAPNSNAVGGKIALNAARAGLKTIMFVQQADHAPSRAKIIAEYLVPAARLTDKEASLWEDIVAEFGGADHSLVRPDAGALPHNGDMLPLERRLAESLFRRPDGISVIVATPTLAQGMNLPAQLAVLAGTMRHDEDGRSRLQAHEILNAAGRAGRAGHLANGTVILVPEPVVAFEADGQPSASAFAQLRELLPENDQCVRINDPLAVLLDRIQGGQLADPGVRYLLSRLRAGEDEDNAQAAAVSMMQGSFAAYQAKLAATEAAFESKIGALREALAGEADQTTDTVLRVASFTGMPVEPLNRIVARAEMDLDGLPLTVVGWSDWFIDFFAEDSASFVALFESDTSTVNFITRGVKKGPLPTAQDFGTLKAGLKAWLEGAPLAAIEAALGVQHDKIKACSRSRDLILRIASRRLYMIATATSELIRESLATANKAAPNPAVLEVLGFAIRKGFDSPEKVAFSYRSPSIRSRVRLHQAYAARFSALVPISGMDFRTILQHIDVQFAFGNLDADDLPA
jgi:ATP-dependent RNA helicase HelY